LKKDIAQQKKELKSAIDASNLIAAMNDLNELLKQKEKQAASDDLGRDLRSVEALQKKHENLENNLNEISEKAKTLNEQAVKLLDNQVEGLSFFLFSFFSFFKNIHFKHLF